MKNRNSEQDLNKLASAFFENLEFQDDCGTGAPGLSEKRPFGNSNVWHDILEIIGAEPEGEEDGDKCYTQEQIDYAQGLYCNELTDYLKAKCAPIFKA